MRKTIFTLAAASAFALGSAASATPFTTTPPNGGSLPSGVTPVGGIVLNLTGLNGAQVTTQAAASSLYVGFAGSNPQAIGVQTGFDATVLAALGGGLSSASARVTLFDGDSAAGDFDFGANAFFVNGVNFGGFSSVLTQTTTSDGLSALGSGFGFANNILSTGFFNLTSLSGLSTLFTSLTGSTATFSLDDTSPFDNYYDFTQGVDGGLINVGSGPIVTPPMSAVPEPSTWAMMISGFGLAGGALRRRRPTRAFARA